jgi:hypothetical protein
MRLQISSQKKKTVQRFHRGSILSLESAHTLFNVPLSTIPPEAQQNHDRGINRPTPGHQAQKLHEQDQDPAAEERGVGPHSSLAVME